MRKLILLFVCAGVLTVSIIAGLMLRNHFTQFTMEEVNRNDPVYDFDAGIALNNYQSHLDAYDRLFLDGDIITAVPVSSRFRGDGILTDIQIQKVYAGSLKEGDIITLVEPYTVMRFSDGTWSKGNEIAGLYIPMECNESYIMNIKYNSRSGLYDYVADNFSCFRTDQSAVPAVFTGDPYRFYKSELEDISEFIIDGDSFVSVIEMMLGPDQSMERFNQFTEAQKSAHERAQSYINP